MNKKILAMLLVIVMIIGMVPMAASAACSFSQHDQMIGLGSKCPICGECGHTYVNGSCRWCGASAPEEPKPEEPKPEEPKPEEPEVDENKCTFGQHDQMIALGSKCPICGEWGKQPEQPEEPEVDEDKCTFGQHDQLIALGTKCPICGEWGKQPEQPEEPEVDEDKCTFGQHDQMIELGCICPICGECGHTYENNACKYCGAKGPFSTPDKDEETEDKKCTFGQHDQLMELGTKCPICGEWGNKDEQPDADVAPEKPGCTFGQHDQMIDLGCICPMCKECGHTYADGVCKYCGEKSPFSTAPDKDEDAENAPQKPVEHAHKWTSLKEGEWFCVSCGKFTTTNPFPFVTDPAAQCKKEGHKMVKDEAASKAPTYLAAGNETHVCSVCGHTTVTQLPQLVRPSTDGYDYVPRTGSAFVEWLYALIFG